MTPVYYNENDPFAAQWLRSLIDAGELLAGDVDERSIEDVRADDLVGYRQAHFFAGVGGWPLALRWAGAEHLDGIWTGSAPCQPISGAGKRQGAADARHLWPAFYELIAECRPQCCFGEQVSGKLGFEWLAGVRLDLEGSGYAVGAADLPACGVGAPHIRRRLWWVAHAERNARVEGRIAGEPGSGVEAEGTGAPVESGRRGYAGSVGNSDNPESQRFGQECVSLESEQEAGRSSNANPWQGSAIIGCADGKVRRIEPGICPLVDGPARGLGRRRRFSNMERIRREGRAKRLKGYGNAIVPQVAAKFIAASLAAISLPKPS